jgi:hypothetical protein
MIIQKQSAADSMNNIELLSRRRFLQSAASAAIALLGPRIWAVPPRKKIPVAAAVTVYHQNSHADVIVGKILEGWNQDGGDGPDLELVALYVDQKPDRDLSAGLAKKHGFRIAKSIDEALTLGGDRLAVRGVLSIGEHGQYPSDPKTGQVLYPRRRFFDDIVATFRRCGQVVPVFSDKHLSAHWSDAKHMYDSARLMKIPFMAGSSIPVMWRNPSETIPLGSEITEAVALGFGGLEAYGFHTLEGLQCLMERRQRGETGVESVQTVHGDGIRQAERDGRWSKGLFDAVVAHSPLPNAGQGPRPDRMSEDAVFYLIDYRDGTNATVAMDTGFTHEFNCGVSMRGERDPFTVTFLGQNDRPFGHFASLLRAIEHMFHTGKPAYPVERTLLTTGILDVAMHSHAENGRRYETPELQIAYQPADWPFAAGNVPPVQG